MLLAIRLYYHCDDQDDRSIRSGGGSSSSSSISLYTTSIDAVGRLAAGRNGDAIRAGGAEQCHDDPAPPTQDTAVPRPVAPH